MFVTFSQGIIDKANEAAKEMKDTDDIRELQDTIYLVRSNAFAKLREQNNKYKRLSQVS